MRLLHVDTSPNRYDSVTRELAAVFVAALRRRYPDLEVIYRDLAADPPPDLDARWHDALSAEPAARDPAMQQMLDAATGYIRDLRAAERYVFAVPMHNFTVPAGFKAYLDHVIQPDETFTYDADGRQQGLLHGKKALIVTARGGYYHTADPASDFQEPYLRKALAFIGVSDVAFVHAEGTVISSKARAESLSTARAELEALAQGW